MCLTQHIAYKYYQYIQLFTYVKAHELTLNNMWLNN